MQPRPLDVVLDTKTRHVNGSFPKTNTQNVVTPPPKISVSDNKNKTRSDAKGFSTPQPQRVRKEQEYKGKPLIRRKSMLDFRSSSICAPPPTRCFSSPKLHDKRIKKRTPSFSKLFDCVGGKVTCVDDVDENRMVDLSNLFLGYRFGHGAHSQLYHGVYKDEAVAVKITRVRDDDEKEGIRLQNQFVREVALLSRLQHQNVIKLVAACRQPPILCVITEYLSKGSLRAYLHKLEENTETYNESLPLEKIIKMGLDISRGMEYVHSQGVIHRDLKPENILLNHDFQMKIADFGISCEERYCDVVLDDPGTYRWMAPEMIKMKPYDRKVDVYAFGLILWEMVAGALPYKDMTPVQAAFSVVHKKLRPPIPSDCPMSMKTLMEQCWSSNPHKRPEFWQVVKILEEFETFLTHNGNLNLLHQYPSCLDQRKSHHQKVNSPTPKPRFS